MKTPDFFAAVPPLRLRDPLADFLGAAQEGIIEYGYVDVVKLAGHSCPTVAAAYGMTRAALSALYGDALPERGGIAVAFRERADGGVTGVIANVVSMLTGAAGEGGFKGLAGRFVRKGLLSFAAEIPLEARFTRLDTRAAVDVGSNVREVAAAADMPELMQRAVAGIATPDEGERFGRLWQDRVCRILLEHLDDPSVFIVRNAAP